MIFGGILPKYQNEEKHEAEEKNSLYQMTNSCFYINVTNGTLKRGPDLKLQSYYTGGGNIISYANKVFAFGFAPFTETYTLNEEGKEGFEKKEGAEKQLFADIMTNSGKKVLHMYKVAEEEWQENNEGLYGGVRKASQDNFDD
mmetsp:Transcript_4825/g.4479  ORF Transcript_4825/g.4479 Transcript_4825/m.4479 type:complete len:143 (+) Transcript_4825:1471-1899(+)